MASCRSQPVSFNRTSESVGDASSPSRALWLQQPNAGPGTALRWSMHRLPGEVALRHELFSYAPATKTGATRRGTRCRRSRATRLAQRTWTGARCSNFWGVVTCQEIRDSTIAERCPGGRLADRNTACTVPQAETGEQQLRGSGRHTHVALNTARRRSGVGGRKSRAWLHRSQIVRGGPKESSAA